MLTFEINVDLLSVNKLYSNIPGQARRFISKEGKAFKEAFHTIITDAIERDSLYKDISNIVGQKVAVFISVGSPTWLLKDGKSIRRKDLDNLCKALQDSVFATLAEFEPSIDDSQIWDLHMEKRITSVPNTLITIQLYSGK